MVLFFSLGLYAKLKSCAPIAVDTAGYEGKSIDMFFDYLLRQGIKTIVDVRFNPGSRKYGFSKKHFREIAKKSGSKLKILITVKTYPIEMQTGKRIMID